jgi:hypothetical protein
MAHSLQENGGARTDPKSTTLERRRVACDASAGGEWSVARRVKDDDAADSPPRLPLTARLSPLLALFPALAAAGAL